MSETWEQTKARLRKQGIAVKEPVIEPPKPRYEEPKEEPAEPRFDLRRVVLPGGQTDYVILNATKKDIQFWLDHPRRFKQRDFKSPIEGIEPIVFYEPVPVNASPAEKSIYYNPRPVITDENIH